MLMLRQVVIVLSNRWPGGKDMLLNIKVMSRMLLEPVSFDTYLRVCFYILSKEDGWRIIWQTTSWALLDVNIVLAASMALLNDQSVNQSAMSRNEQSTHTGECLSNLWKKKCQFQSY